MSTILKENQLQAVTMTASGQRGCDIAESLAVSRETVSRWRQLPEFQAAVNTMLRDAQNATRDRLRGLAGKALDTVEEVLQDKAVPASERLKAAFKVLDLCGAESAANEPGLTDSEKIRKAEQQSRDMDAMLAM